MYSSYGAYPPLRGGQSRRFDLPKEDVKGVFQNCVDRNQDGKVSATELKRAAQKFGHLGSYSPTLKGFVSLFKTLATDLESRRSVGDKNQDGKISYRSRNSELDQLAARKPSKRRLSNADLQGRGSSCGCSGGRSPFGLDSLDLGFQTRPWQENRIQPYGDFNDYPIELMDLLERGDAFDLDELDEGFDYEVFNLDEDDLDVEDGWDFDTLFGDEDEDFGLVFDDFEDFDIFEDDAF